VLFFFSSRRRHTRFSRDWSSDVCSSDLNWGSVSVDPARNRLVVNVQMAPFSIKLVPRGQPGEGGHATDLVGMNPQQGTPYMAVQIGRASYRERGESREEED